MNDKPNVNKPVFAYCKTQISKYKMHIEAYVNNVKLFNSIIKPQNTLTIGASTSFKKIVLKLTKSKKLDAVWVKKPNQSQLAAILLVRLLGKKFLWIQNFSNPPIPSFLTRLLLNQADIVITHSRDNARKLKTFGVDKPKIVIQK